MPNNTYLGNLFNSCVSHTAEESTANEPDWCIAAMEVGTYVRRVVIPRVT